MAAWFAGQVAVLHSPVDVSICVFTKAEGLPKWSWLRWLPPATARREDSDPRISSDATSHGQRLTALLSLVDERRRRSREIGAGHEADVVVFLDGARGLGSLPGMKSLVREGPKVGVYVVCLDEDPHLLPEECRLIIQQRPDGLLDILGGTAGPERGVRPDAVAEEWFDRVARSLAPIRDGYAGQGSQELQGRRLTDLLGLDPPDAMTIAERWRQCPRNTAVRVGQSMGSPFSLDLCRDGPHALVAGTWGAGKTEFLRTWIASLAVANRPDELTFFLVDCKGKAAFRAFSELPHTVGVIVDLDAHLADRALTALAAELRRREQILHEARVKDIEDYLLLRARKADMQPLPRLVLVIDELASVIAEAPDFVLGLMRIARRGRSLGIHLVVATQRPSGVMSLEIRATTNLRIGLRLINTHESTDVIDAPNAAYIPSSQPGRAYVRSGAGDLVAVHAATVGNRPSPADSDRTVMVRTTDSIGAVRGPVWLSRRSAVDAADGPTDLDLLVEAICEAAELLAVPRPPCPLPPPLEDRAEGGT